MAKKKKKVSRRPVSLFKLASKDRGYKSASAAKKKAEARSKKAWRSALAKAKKQIRKRK